MGPMPPPLSNNITVSFMSPFRTQHAKHLGPMRGNILIFNFLSPCQYYPGFQRLFFSYLIPDSLSMVYFILGILRMDFWNQGMPGFASMILLS